MIDSEIRKRARDYGSRENRVWGNSNSRTAERLSTLLERSKARQEQFGSENGYLVAYSAISSVDRE